MAQPTVADAIREALVGTNYVGNAYNLTEGVSQPLYAIGHALEMALTSRNHDRGPSGRPGGLAEAVYELNDGLQAIAGSLLAIASALHQLAGPDI